MHGVVKKASNKVGLPPGALVHVGERKEEHVRLSIIDYDEEHLGEVEISAVEDCFPYRDTSTVTWINVYGIHDMDVMRKIGGHFGIHALALEDIMNTGHRPKLEVFDDYVLVILKMLDYDAARNEIVAEQVSLVLFRNLVFCFQEREGDVFDPVRERIRNKGLRIRSLGADYLAYALMDVVVDRYFTILENSGERIEDLEEELEANPSPSTMRSIRDMKRQMILLRRSVWPLREMISGMEKVESLLIRESVKIYLRDVYDHTIQIIDTIESDRDILAGMVDIYLSAISNRMNEVMKVLTIIATIFIPLTFIAGIYGMNFQFMPELKLHWGYPAVLVLMVIIGVTMLIYFKRRKWL